MKVLLKYFDGYKKECVLGPLFKLLEASFELLVPLVIASIIDIGIATGDKQYILSRVLILFVLAVIGLVCSLLAQFYSAKAATGFAAKVRSVLFEHTQGLSYSEVDRVGTATLINRMTADINQLQSGVNMTLRLFLRSPFIVFGAMIMAFTIDVKMSLIFLVTIVLLSIVVYGIMIITYPMQKNVQKSVDKVLSRTRDNLTGVRVIRAFNLEAREENGFNEDNDKLTRISLLAGRISALTNPLTFIIVNFATVYLIYKGAINVSTAVLSAGSVVALVNYMSQILVELIKLANFIVLDIKAAACASRISDVLSMNDALVYGDEKLSEEDMEITFDNVSFRYSEGADYALENVSFTARKGETVGIIGGTGSGKSTLINLLIRNYDVSKGQILINGKKIDSYSKAAIGRMFAVVPQKAQLFSGSIRNNLLYGKEDASHDEIVKALDNACALEFVKEKEGEIDFELAAKGKNLSGGQKQRLTIARALIKKAPVLVLDDSMSALDALTSVRLSDNIKRLEDNPIVFLVSQRTSALTNADKIIVLDDGDAVGVGTHEELLKGCEVYREIHESQYQTGKEV